MLASLLVLEAPKAVPVNATSVPWLPPRLSTLKNRGTIHTVGLAHGIGGVHEPLVVEVVLALDKAAEFSQQFRVVSILPRRLLLNLKRLLETPANPKASTPWPIHHWVRMEAVPARLALLRRDHRDEQGAHHHPGIEILVVDVVCRTSGNGMRFSPKVMAVRALLPHDIALPTGHDLGGEGSGHAVIGGLTPEVLWVPDLPLDLGRFRRLAVGAKAAYRYGACCTGSTAGSQVSRSARRSGPPRSRRPERLGHPDLGQAGGGHAGHLEGAVLRRLRPPFAEHGPVLAHQQFGLGPVQPEHGVAQPRGVGLGSGGSSPGTTVWPRLG